MSTKKEPIPAHLMELHKLPLEEQKTAWMKQIQPYAKDASADSMVPLHVLMYGLRTLLAPPVFHYHHVMEILAAIETLRLQATHAATMALQANELFLAVTTKISGEHDIFTTTEVEQLSRLLPKHSNAILNESIRLSYVNLITTLMQLEVFRSHTSPSVTDRQLAKVLDEYFVSDDTSYTLHRFLHLPNFLFKGPDGSRLSREAQEREQLKAAYKACRKFLRASTKTEASVHRELNCLDRWSNEFLKLYLERLPADVLPVRHELTEFVSRVDLYVEHVENLVGLLDTMAAGAPDMNDKP